jgi:hypothetical protein
VFLSKFTKLPNTGEKHWFRFWNRGLELDLAPKLELELEFLKIIFSVVKCLEPGANRQLTTSSGLGYPEPDQGFHFLEPEPDLF